MSTNHGDWTSEIIWLNCNCVGFQAAFSWPPKSPSWLVRYWGIKDLCRNGWNTQICQLQGRGGLKTPIELLKPNIFLIFLWKYFPMHIEYVPVWYFSYLCGKLAITQSYCFFELRSKLPKSKIHQKIPTFEQLKNQVLVTLH